VLSVGNREAKYTIVVTPSHARKEEKSTAMDIDQGEDVNATPEPEPAFSVVIGSDKQPLTCIAAAQDEDLCVCAYAGLGTSIYLAYHLFSAMVTFTPLSKLSARRPINSLALTIHKQQSNQWKLTVYSGGQELIIQEHNLILKLDNEKNLSANLYATLQLVGQEEPHRSDIRHILVTKQHNHVLSASDDGVIKVWERESRKCVSTMVGHTNDVLRVAAQDDFILSAGKDRIVNIWTKKEERRKKKREQNLATASVEYVIEAKITTTSVVTALATPSEKFVCVGGKNGTVSIWQLTSADVWTLVSEKVAHDGSVNTLVNMHVSGGDGLLSVGHDGKICFWKIVQQS